MRYITNKPDASAFSAVVGAEVNTTKDGEEGYDFDATVNIPIIEDKLAIRLTGFSATEGGYIDNVLGTTVVDGPNQNGSGFGGKKTNASPPLMTILIA